MCGEKRIISLNLSRVVARLMAIMANTSKGSTARKERRKEWWKKKSGDKSELSTEAEGIKLRVRKPKPDAEETRQASVIETQHGFKLKLKLTNSTSPTKPVKKNLKTTGKAKTVQSNDTSSVSKTQSSPKKKGAKVKETEVPAAKPPVPKPKSYVLFVGNLPFDVTKEQLLDHFRKTGGAKGVRIPKEKGTDKGRGFAYMEFKDGISYRVGLRLHQTTLGGRRINVEFTSIGGNNKQRRDKLREKNKTLENFKMALEDDDQL